MRWRKLVHALGHVDHVASFTGEQPVAPVADTTHELYRAPSTPGCGRPATCPTAVQRMGEHGSFTFCSGLSAWRPRPHRAAGAAATAALESFARASAVELARRHVNSVCPGAFDTPVLDRAFGADKQAALAPYLSTLPLGRLGRPAELAHAVLFLMSNDYVTGNRAARRRWRPADLSEP